MEIVREFEYAIAASLAAHDRLVVAVSGGMDSMCLLWLCLHASCLPQDRLSVVTIDHKLRQSSARDVAFVKEFCTAHGVACYDYTVDVAKNAKETGHGIEMQARTERRKIFDALLASGKADKVLTAHHADDCVETVLMHLFRGAGLGGICGMRTEQGGLLRPLLRVKKQQIVAYATKHNIPFVTDETNTDTQFTRNFIRQELLPLIRQRYAGVDDAVLRLADEATQTQAFLDSVVDGRAISVAADAVSVQLDALADPFLARHLLKSAIGRLLGAFVDIEAKHINAVAGLVDSKNGAGLDLPRNLRAVREYDRITIYRNCAFAKADEVKLALGELVCGGQNIEVAQSSADEMRCNKQPLGERTLYFDPACVPQDAVLRSRREGDVFCPYGGRTKKLKAYLIDKKIPLRRRDKLVCLAVDSEVLAVVGVEISDKIKVTEGADIWSIRTRT